MLAQILTQIASILGGGINSALGLVVSNMQKGFQAAIQFHKEGVAFARDVGLSAKQAQSYTKTLIERTQVLANRYGVSADAIMQVQRGLSEATGKQLMLNNAQAESIVQIDKMVGAQTRVKFQEEMMNGMGAQVDTVNKAIANVYATATKQGLVAKKLTDKVAQNLGMANRLSFKDGIGGLTRMAALSEKLGMNMQSVESAAGQFMDLDKAIENAAQMQMLGGSAAANFGNPLTAAYEANYDPEAFAQRMSDSLGSYATFDASKGISNINGMNMDFVRNIAKTMGISVDEASKMAKKQAEVRYKENALGGTLDRVAGGNEAKRNYILNNAQVTNGGRDLEIQGKNINEISDKEWDELMKLGNMSDEEILREQAMTLTSIDEQLSGAQASVTAGFAKGLSEYIPDIQKKIQSLGDYFSHWSEQWGAATGRVVGKAMGWLDKNGDKIVSVADGILGGITRIFNFFSNHWGALLAAIAGWKALKGLFGINLGGGTSLGARAASGAAKGLKSLGSKLYKESPMDWFRQSYKWSRNPANPARVGRMKAFGGALKDSWQGASKLAKGTAIAGVAMGAVEGATAFMDYSTKKKQLKDQLDRGEISKEEYNSQINEARVNKNEKLGGAIGGTVGTALGTAIGGPIGGIVAGYLGDKLGSFIGKHWDGITSRIGKAWTTSINWVGDKTKAAVSAIGDKFSEWGQSVSGWWTEVVTPVLKDGIKSFGEGAKSMYHSAIDGLSTITNKAKNFFKDVPIFNGLTTFIDAIVNLFKQPRELLEKAKKGFHSAIQTIVNFPETIEQWLYDYTSNKKWLPTMGHNYKAESKETHASGGFINDGASGVEHPVLAQKGEAILNPSQQKNFMQLANDYSKIVTNNSFMNNNVTSLMPRVSEVVSKPVVGEKPEYIYKPNRTETSNINGNTITVKDFNINLSGTLKLDGGNSYKNIDMNALLNDYQFMNALKEMIKTSINNDMNGGRFMNDLASRRGQVSSLSIIR